MKLEKLLIRVSRTKGQEIVIADEIFDLQDLLKPGERLIIDVFSPINYIRYRFKNK